MHINEEKRPWVSHKTSFLSLKSSEETILRNPIKTNVDDNSQKYTYIFVVGAV